jgi:hypothetical protein
VFKHLKNCTFASYMHVQKKISWGARLIGKLGLNDIGGAEFGKIWVRGGGGGTYFFHFGTIWQDQGWNLKLLMHSFYEAIDDFCIQFLSKVIEIIVLRYCILGTYDQCRLF